jgi:nicotinate-nucleotide adenylyltransferase
MRIGLFGGTFNPPHVGHLIIAEVVREELELDKVLFIPCANPPHKTDIELVDAIHRLEMTRLAVKNNLYFDVSDIEIRRGGKSYTIDTVRSFKSSYPGDNFFLLIGVDQLIEFHTWREPEEILNTISVVVFNRPPFDISMARREYIQMTKFIRVPDIEISATEIRNRIRAGRSIRYFVPDEVELYIRKNNLYR